jgi:flagellar assembly factor FliW
MINIIIKEYQIINMAKELIKEIKKTTHKLTVEGTISVNGDNTIEFDVPDEGFKKLHELIKNFSGEYVKFAIQTEEQEDVE